MSLLSYYTFDEYRSYVIVDPCDPWMDVIYRHRGRQYAPRGSGGAKGFIADTGITLEFPGDGDLAQLRERSVWDTLEAPQHKLRRTAHFLVTRGGETNREYVILTGWIVPFSLERGLPMENRWPEAAQRAYDWSPCMNGEDAYLRDQHIAGPLSNDLVEIGRLCRIKSGSADSGSFIPILLGFRTLHRFLEEVGVKNYVCAAIDEPGARYASLYEGTGLRKVSQYELATVTGLREQDGAWTPVSQVLRYWALHMNLPHTQQRVLNRDFGIPRTPGAARLNERMLAFVTPYLFDPSGYSWIPDAGEGKERASRAELVIP